MPSIPDRGRAPVLFISHGAPSVALEQNSYTRALADLGRGLAGRPALVIVSAHWEAQAPVRVTASARPGLIHDFFGFPEELSRLEWPAAGEPALAARVAGLLDAGGIPCQLDDARGWDHGVWIPLRLMLPTADVPVVAVSLPRPRSPEVLRTIGQLLAPLRDDGVALIGSGGAVHNLRRLRLDDDTGQAEPWAQEFESWLRERLDTRDGPGLLDYAQRAPHARLAVPTSEHLDPLFFAVGALSARECFETAHQGFRYGSLSMLTLATA